MKVLSDRVAVVTGAAGGIGRALSLEFARAGMHVVLADRDEPGMRGLAEEIRGLGRKALVVPTDVRDPRQLEALLGRTLSELGGCHLVANNAGAFVAAPLIEMPESEWERVVGVNLWGVIHGSRIFGAHFAKKGEGHVLNTASAAGLFPMPGMSSYSTTKFAIVGFSLQLRWELAEAGVGVTVMCPGVVKTPIATRPGVGLEHLNAAELTKNAPSAEGLARKALRAVRKNRAMLRYGPDSYVLSWLRWLPMWLLDPLGRFMGRTALKTVRKPSELPAAK